MEIAFTSLHQEYLSNLLEIDLERSLCYPSKSNFQITIDKNWSTLSKSHITLRTWIYRYTRMIDAVDRILVRYLGKNVYIIRGCDFT